MPKLVGINHLAVPVRAIDEMLTFLAQIFDDVKLRGRSGGMAFVDMGDQFIALEDVGKSSDPGRVSSGHPGGHIGLVVDDREETVQRARDAGAQMVGGHDFLDPSGNRWQVVDYRDIQFTKTPRILEGMGLSDLDKSERALGELRAANLAD